MREGDDFCDTLVEARFEGLMWGGHFVVFGVGLCFDVGVEFGFGG